MNIYFLVEGKRTEVKVYPKWLSLWIPELKQVKYFEEVTQNNYYVFSGAGFPAILDKIAPAILRKFVAYYNTKTSDPELMNKLDTFAGSVAVFQASYFEELLFEKSKVRYSKRNPQEVVEKYYLDELKARAEQTNHLQSFKYFLEFCSKARGNIAL